MIHTHALYQSVLLAPRTRNADELRIVSGYATSAMAERHLQECAGLKLALIVGMCPRDGITITNHRGFRDLVQQHPSIFQCRYSLDIPVHSKLYVWYSHGQPIEAYIGSANYTQQAFLLNTQEEVLASCDPVEAEQYYNNALTHTVSCDVDELPDQIALVRGTHSHGNDNIQIHHALPATIVHQSIELPLIVESTGEVHETSGLNWGQREGRNHDQAYIPVPSRIAQTDFFPPRAVRFNVLTDDGERMVMAVAQGGNKALHTPENNSIIGRYFRNRLGIPSGEFVTRAHLDAYGRTTVTFTKFDDENYFMDFRAGE